MKVKIITALVLILILSLTFMACQEDIAINGFSIDLSNLTLEIEKGTDVDFSKIIVNAERVDDTSIPLKSNQYSIDLGGFDKDVPGEYTITITYGSYGSKTFIVIVSDKAADAKTVSSIAVSTNSTHKTAFAYNEAFSYANLTIEVTYTDGTNENITEGFEVVSTEYNKAHGMGSAKDYLITVNYGSQSTSYAISVAADPSKVIKSIKAVGSFKTQYNYYESFTAENVELEVTTEDNNTSIISNGFDVDSTAFNKLHGQTEAQIYNIKLTYMSKECSYNVTVAGGIVSNIVAVNTEADRTFKYGQPFSWGDTKVYAQYENSEYIELLTRSETTGAGKYSFEVAYNHDHKQSTAQTFTITVKYSAEITSFYTVSVAKMPDDMFYRVSNDSTHKTEFLEDEEFSYEGLILEKVSASEVAAAAQDPNYALYPIAVTIPRDCEIECNNFNSNQKGYYAVYAVADGTSYYLYSVYVDIDDNNLAVSITPNNFSTIYYVGQNLNLTGCSITITYQDGSTTELFLPSNQVTINGFNSETIGKITLTVNYGELQAVVSNIDIVEDEVVGIAIADNSKHRVYFYYAEPFSGNGLIVNAVYASGKIRTLSAGEYSIDESEYGIESNNYFIAIRYEEIEINYEVFVAAFEAETKPYFLGYDYNSFFEVSDNNWEIIFGERGSHSFAATLEADTLSTISVMVGKWMGGEDFLALNPDEYGYYSIYYTATSILTLTVRITHANGIDYVDHYAHIKPTIFNSFTVNGDEIILYADKVVDYFINDISNEYMVNWSINEEYTVETEIVRDKTYKMDRFGINVRDYYDITISHKGNFVVTYRIFIYSFILINSFTIEGVEINYSEDNIHVATWEHYDIAKDYNYVIDVYSDYTAILTYRGVKQSTLSGSLLFGGGNFFEIDIYDGNNYYVTTYDFILFVDINISDIFDSVTMDENQLYYGVSIWEVGNITQPSSVGAVGDYALYFDVKSGISVDLSIVGSDWTNGDNITLDSGKNEFVLVVSYGGYEYQFYLVFYAEYDRFYNWHGYEVEVRGEIAENSETLPSKADTQIIRVPAGYTVTEDDVNIIYDEEDESLLYEASIESNQIKITVKMADGGQIVGYIYVLMVIDGEVNDDAETFFMLRSFYNYAIEDESQDSLTKIEFTENGEGNFIAEVNIPDKSSFLYKKPYFAQAEITIDKSEGLELHEEIYFGSFGCKYLYSYIVVGEVGSTFTYSITVTSSSTLVTQTYTIIFTIIEPIYEFAFDFGQDFVEKFELFDLAPYLFSGEDMEIDLVLAELPQDAVSYNGEQIIVTFAIVSDRIYSYDQDMEEEVNIVNGSIVTFVLTKVGENVYAIPPFIYHLNYSERYDMEFAIVIRFIVEN